MPQTIETVVYRLGELDETAKDRARSWYREAAIDHDWHEFVFEDFATICAIVGLTLKTDQVRLMGGDVRQKPRIYFSGFSSQGDGACFAANYSYRRGAAAALRAHAPKDSELHRIAETLQRIQRRNFYQLRADATHRGRYYHEYSMEIGVQRESGVYQDMTGDAKETVTEALRDLARWLYRRLEREYDFQTSDAVIDETLEANDYTFTETGGRVG